MQLWEGRKFYALWGKKRATFALLHFLCIILEIAMLVYCCSSFIECIDLQPFGYIYYKVLDFEKPTNFSQNGANTQQFYCLL